jgi:monofunctional biosynthetic peptidoglycan transglycosylase
LKRLGLRLLARVYLVAVLLGAPLAWLWRPGVVPPWAWLAMQLGLSVLFISVAVVLALRWLNPPSSAFMLAEKAALRRSAPGARLEHSWVGQAGLAPELRLAAIVSEDTYFAFHAGFDWDSLRAAQEYNKTAAHKRGASTITQQVAKNLFLWEYKSYARKALEAYFTLLIEAAWPKRRILEVYLNIAQFGPRTFGAQAAAQRFFGKPASALSGQEAALLISVLPSPRKLAVEHPSHQVRFRQAMVLNGMKRVGVDYLARLDVPGGGLSK